MGNANCILVYSSYIINRQPCRWGVFLLLARVPPSLWPLGRWTWQFEWSQGTILWTREEGSCGQLLCDTRVALKKWNEIWTLGVAFKISGHPKHTHDLKQCLPCFGFCASRWLVVCVYWDGCKTEHKLDGMLDRKMKAGIAALVSVGQFGLTVNPIFTFYSLSAGTGSTFHAGLSLLEVRSMDLSCCG